MLTLFIMKVPICITIKEIIINNVKKTQKKNKRGAPNQYRPRKKLFHPGNWVCGSKRKLVRRFPISRTKMSVKTRWLCSAHMHFRFGV